MLAWHASTAPRSSVSKFQCIKRLRCGLEKLTLWKLVDVVPVISVLMRFSMPICRSERLGRAREFVENLSSTFQSVVRPTSNIQSRSNPNGI